MACLHKKSSGHNETALSHYNTTAQTPDYRAVLSSIYNQQSWKEQQQFFFPTTFLPAQLSDQLQATQSRVQLHTISKVDRQRKWKDEAHSCCIYYSSVYMYFIPLRVQKVTVSIVTAFSSSFWFISSSGYEEGTLWGKNLSWRKCGEG